MRSILTIVSVSVPVCVSLCTPVIASSIGYALADANGRLSVSIPSSSWWANGTSTANAAAGVTIGGTAGGSFTGSYNSPVLPTWSGTLGANGTTLTASAANGATAPAPTASSVPFYPLGFWNSGRPGGAVINIPTTGYFNITKNNNNGAASLTNTLGNATALGSASWTWAPAGFNDDWNGTENATVGKVARNGAALPANTRAVADVSDPIYLFVPADGDLLTFQVALANLEMDIAPDQPADAYYSWTVMFGAGDVAGENVLYTYSGGQDYSSPGTYTPNPGTVVNFSNSSLSEGVYWLTADLNLGAEINDTPEPATFALMGGCLLVLSAVLRRKASLSIRRSAPVPHDSTPMRAF